MSILVSKEALYRQQENYAAAESHVILPSTTTSVSGVTMTSHPHHVIAINVPNATGDIDVDVIQSGWKLLDAWAVKNTNAAGAGDDVIIKHVAVDGTTVTNVALFTTINFQTAMGAASRRQNFPNILEAQPVFTDRCKLRISANSGVNCGCTVFIAVGLV